MATDTQDLQRTIETLKRLSEAGRRTVRDLVEFLADREELNLVDDEDLAEDRELFDRVAAGDRSGTVSLHEAKQRVLGTNGG